MQADTDSWKENNVYFEKLAKLLDFELQDKKWSELKLRFDIYEPDVGGNVFSTMELTVLLGGKSQSMRAPSEVYDILKSLGDSMERTTGDRWSSLVFELDCSGNMEVEFGYEKLFYNLDDDDFYD